MLRLLWGILLGIVVGGAIAALLVKGLGVVILGAFAAYGLALAVGALTGLLAGKPIWAEGARIEGGLKAFFGALLAAGLMLALRSWAKVDLNLSAYGLGQGALGELVVTSLPLISVALALVFEVDNLFGKDDAKSDGGKKRVAAAGEQPRLRAGAPETVDASVEPEASEKPAARRKH